MYAKKERAKKEERRDEEDGDRERVSEVEKAVEQDEGRDDKERGNEIEREGKERRETFILTLGQEKYTAENSTRVRK